MKKLCLFIGLLFAPMHVHAVELYLGNSGSNLNGTIPAAGVSAYYKCTNSVPFSCQSDAIKITYTSKTGGSGTSASPYTITGCAFVSCACSYKSYLSGVTCKECSDNALGSPNVGDYHTNTSCQYCPSNKLKKVPAPNVTVCLDCSPQATCDGSTTAKCVKSFYGNGETCSQCPPSYYQSCVGSFGTTAAAGATDITECYIAKDGSFCDETGKGNFTDTCSYTK